MIAIKTDSLSKRYDQIEAVTDVSFSTPFGQSIGLLGPNGSGKTTLLKMIAGHLEPDSGTVSLNGHSITQGRDAALQQVSALIQDHSPLNPGQSLIENLPPGEEREHLLRELRLWEHREEAVGTLSHGFQQRAYLSYTLLSPAPIILLDEPMLGLDEGAKDSLKTHIRNLVEREKKTVVVATCRQQWINAFCDRAIVLKEGHVIADIPISRRLGLTQKAIYEIRVKGVLETRWATWFDGLTVTPLSDETVLCGQIIDQPALHSVLVKIRDLGLPLVSLHYIDPTLGVLQG